MRHALLALVFLAAPAAAETVVVRQIGTYFSPKIVVVAPGDSVRWEWTGGTHTVTEGTDGVINGNELWTSPLTSTVPVFTFAFTPAFLAANPRPGGRYDYFCQPHFLSGMVGAVIVADPAPGTVTCSGDGSATPCPCGNTSTAPTGCLNSSGVGARLRSSGTASVSADTLTLWVSGAPESLPFLFFQGSAALGGGAGVVFGDGLRCAGGTNVRLAPKTIGFGYASYPALGDIAVGMRGFALPGSVLHYQGWFQDMPSTCTGAHFNLTNAVSVTWLP